MNEPNEPGYGLSPLQDAGHAFRFCRRTHEIKKRSQPLNNLAAQKIERLAGFEQEDRRRLKSPVHNGVGYFLQQLKVLRRERCCCRAGGKRMHHRTPKTVPEQYTRHTPPYGKFGRVGQSQPSLPHPRLLICPSDSDLVFLDNPKMSRQWLLVYYVKHLLEHTRNLRPTLIRHA